LGVPHLVATLQNRVLHLVTNQEHKISSACSVAIFIDAFRAIIAQDFASAVWPISCYAYEKYIENQITGDVSPEELRWEAYNQMKSGNIAQYVCP
jgi:hypothetical protein